MNVRISRSVCCFASIAAVAAAAGLVSARPPQYTWRIPGVPDFDQVRGAIFNVPGLPGNGSMYCYPTAAVNWMNYIASRGYPLVSPGPGFKGQPYGNVYNQITETIDTMGAEMNTSETGGTGINGAIAGIEAFLDDAYPGDFTVQWWSCSRGVCPNYSTITNNMRDGRVVILGIGWYSADDEIEGNFNRGGGHAVSLTGADDYFLPSRTWRYTDPGSTDGQLFNQGVYVTHSTGVEMQNWNFNNTVNATLPRLMAYTSAFIDNYGVITPKFGWAARPDLTGIDQITAPLHPTHANPFLPPVHSFESPDGTPIVDVLMHPQLDRVLIRTAGNPATGFPGGISVCMADSSVHLIRDNAGVQAMVFSRNLELFVLEGQTLSRYTEDERGNLQRSMIRSLTVTFDAMGYDDRSDEVVLISGGRGRIARFDQELVQVGPEEHLPDGVNPTGPFTFALWPDDTYIIADAGAGELIHLARREAARGREHILLARQSFPELHGAGKVSMQDIHFAHRVMLPAGGFIREYQRTPTGFERVVGGRFDGMPAGPFADFSASRSNFDPALHTGPGWETVEPTEFGEVVPTCDADVNQNGKVEFGDITTVLARFGQASLAGDLGDADLDGDCDFADITFVLAYFGTDCR
ncbi:MAG: hypothetical protein JNK58_11965 [Phycisphaerae bacterium]|nr:hypothetical protein [Phycisphaerae bacterium]